MGQPFPSIIANSSASPHHLPPPHATHTHTLPLQQQLHANTALPQDLKPPAEQLPAQVPLQLPSQLPAPGHAPMSQRAAQQQQAQGSISPALQEAEQRASRVWVPLHKGVGLVRLCISAEPNTGSHSNKPQQGAPASPWLVSKYAAWPFTCLWPESPPSQPPPLPSRSPSPPPIPPSNTGHGPTHRQPHTQPATVISQRMAYGMDPQGFQAPSAAEQQASASVAGSIHRPSGKQAPKVLMEPDFGNSALEEPLQPASKRHRGGLSRSPDEGRPGGPHASSRYACQFLTCLIWKAHQTFYQLHTVCQSRHYACWVAVPLVMV